MYKVIKTTYECEILTPAFINGANKSEPELRTSSLKGVMRFWWRALQSNLPIKDLKEQEGQIFGSSEDNVGKSKFKLRIVGEIEQDSVQLVTGKNKTNTTIKALKPGEKFNIIISSISSTQEHRLYEKILEISLLLGGLGKRSRRGRGSIQIIKRNNEDYQEPQNLDDIIKLINLVNKSELYCKKKEDNKGNEKIVINHSLNEKYPYVKEIEIGKKYSTYNVLLEKIDETSHNVKKGGSDYTGFASGSRRLASPIYVSVLKNKEGKYKPIITTLNTVFENGYKPREKNKQEEFKEEIL